jgi:lipid-A-disaccharide synthase
MSPLTVMLVAAEASGDVLGAGLARALQAQLGDRVRFVGVGGPRMAEAGVASPFDIAELSVLGLWEGVKAYPRVVRRVAETAELAKRERPDVAVLIDSWGFTLRVAHALRRINPALPLVKYVGPQVWATRPGRARTLARAVDLLLTIHAFDAPWFEAEGLKTIFVGSPALARDFSTADPHRLRTHIGASAEDPILLVLPGSRPSEIARMAPVFGDTVARLVADRPSLRIVIPVAQTVRDRVRQAVNDWSVQPHLIEDEALKADALCAGTVALACSGTVTTELALAGRPLVVAYRIGELTYRILKRLIRTPYASLINIAACRFVAPEFIQHACTADNLAAAVGRLLDDADLRARQTADQDAALELMGRGQGDPSAKAAHAVLALLAERGRPAV